MSNGDWMARATADAAGARQDAGSATARCPAAGVGSVTVQVWDPKDGTFLGDSAVRLVGPAEQHGTTAADTGTVSFPDLPAGAFNVYVALGGQHAKTHRIDPPGGLRLEAGEAKTVVVAARRVIPKVTATLRRKPVARVTAAVKSGTRS